MQETIFTKDLPAGRIYPGNRTYGEYIADIRASGEMADLEQSLAESAQERFLELGLSGQVWDKTGQPVNLNTYFDRQVFFDERIYTQAKDAYKREQNGTATQADVDLLTQVRDPDGQVRKRILKLSSSDPILARGFEDTGGFPRSLFDDEIAVTDEIKQEGVRAGYQIGDTNITTFTPSEIIRRGASFIGLDDTIPNGRNFTEEDAIRRTQDIEALQDFLGQNVNVPSDPVIRDALDAVVSGGVMDIVVERMYNLADVTDEGIEHYLPRLFHWATNYNLTTDNSFGLTSAENFITDEAVAADLAQVRALSSFADRGKVLNDLIREQVINIVGQERYDASIYAQKVEVTYETADGEQVTKEEYRHKFVSDDFAEQFFEATLNSKGFFDKMAVFMLENVAAGGALKLPFAVAGAVTRASMRGAASTSFLSSRKIGTAPVYVGRDTTKSPGRILSADEVADLDKSQYFTLPYSAAFMTPDELVRYTKSYADFQGVPFTVAAKSLQRLTRAENGMARTTLGLLTGTGMFRSGSLAAKAESGSVDAALATSYTSNSKIIREAEDRIKKGVDNNDSKAVVEAGYDLRTAVAQRNWAAVKSVNKTAREFGFAPGFDTAVAFTQAFNRSVFVDNVNNPQFGAMTDFYSAISVMSLTGVKRMFNIRGGIPFVSNAAASAMYTAKATAEDMLGHMFEGLQSIPKGLTQDAEDALRRAGSARGYGIFTPPGLRNLLDTNFEDTANLPISTRRLLQNFSTGVFRTLTPDDRAAMLDDFAEGYADTQNVLRPFYTLTDSQGNGLFSQAELRELERNISLNVGEMSGIGLILSIQRQRQAANAGTTMGAFLNVKQKVADFMSIQRDSKKQIAAMVAASELLDAQILKLNAADTSVLNPMEKQARAIAIDNLQLFSQQFKQAALIGQQSFDQLLKLDAEAAVEELDVLLNPANSKMLDKAHSTGALQSLINRIGLYERSIAANRSFVAGTEGQTPADIDAERAMATEMRIGNQLVGGDSARDTEARMLTVSHQLNRIREASANSINLSRPYASAADITSSQSNRIINTIARERMQSDEIIDTAYANVSDEIDIDISPMLQDLETEFKRFSKNTDTYLDAINPNVFDFLGGGLGKRFYRDMNDAARRSLISFITPQLEAINSSQKALDGGVAYESAEHYLHKLRERIVIDDEAAAKAMGAAAPSEINDLQLMLYLIQSPNAPIDAAGLKLMASPMQLETFRQAGNRMARAGRDGNDPRAIVGSNIKTAVDKAFSRWSTSANVDDYNQVVVARTVFRAEQLRFEKGTTLGGEVEANVTGRQLDGQDNVKRDLSKVLSPLVNTLKNPNENSISEATTQIQKIINTLAPINQSLLQARLVKDVDGRFVPIDNEEEIGKLVQRTVDLETFQEMKLLIGNAMRNAFYDVSGMPQANSALSRGLIPSLVTDDAPKKIQLPAGYDNLEQYFSFMENAAVVRVEMPDGNIVTRKLIDMDDLVHADREITFVVNATLDFREAHADLTKIINNARTQQADAASTLKGTQAEVTKVQTDVLPRSFSGKGFVKNVMESDDPDAGVVFMRQLTTSKAFTSMAEADQQKALQSLFISSVKELGGYTPTGNRTVRMFNGQLVATGQYNTPESVFVALDDGLNSTTQAGIALRQLADAAGVTGEQYETLHSLFRMSVKLDASGVLARSSDGNLTSMTKGFTLDNALSKAFNLARGMVSKEYVMAEVAIRYAALSRGKSIDFLLNDPRSAKIVKNLLEDDTLVADEDAYYFATQLSKFVADEIPRGMTELDVASSPYLEEYFVEIGALQPVDVGTIVFNVQ